MLIPFRTVKESVELLNNSKYGSGVSIHSQDISLGIEKFWFILNFLWETI